MRKCTYKPDMPDRVLKACEQWEEDKFPIASKVQVCKLLDISKRTLLRWCEQFDELQEACEMVMEAQERMLLNNGLSGKYNALLTKMMLGNHGYSDKQTTDLNGAVTVMQRIILHTGEEDTPKPKQE